MNRVFAHVYAELIGHRRFCWRTHASNSDHLWKKYLEQAFDPQAIRQASPLKHLGKIWRGPFVYTVSDGGFGYSYGKYVAILPR